MNTSEIIDVMSRPWKPIKLAYCDYIALAIGKALKTDALSNYNSLIKNVGSTAWDLHPEEGYMLSTTKTIEVEDTQGKMYRVTVEEIND